MRKGRKSWYETLALATQLGFSVSLPIVGGAFLGQYVDRIFGSSPKMTLSFIFLGVFLGIMNIYFVVKEIGK